MKQLYFVALMFFSSMVFSQIEQSVELGHVRWLRDYDKAVEKAKVQNKAVFILFQEVPGCSTCRNFGKNILEHPLIIETIEDFFIPLAIYNNKEGHDLEILEKYKEPAWNNPVMRIVNHEGSPVLVRLSGHYDSYSIVQYMVDALIELKIPVPAYLDLIRQEFLGQFLGEKETIFSMYCFWSGEKNIGKLPGVTYTEAGFMNGQEVVKVRYSPNLISYDKILQHASSFQCADGSYTDDKSEQKIARTYFHNEEVKTIKKFRRDHQDKYYLGRSNFQYLPLTDLQKTRINSYLGDRLDPKELLSPKQISLFNKITKNKIAKKSMIRVDVKKANHFYNNT